MLTVDVSGALTAAGYENHVIERIIRMLTEAESAVKQSKEIAPVPATSYGNSSTATELGLHTGKAHDHVIEAMTQMVTGLESYHRGVKRFREDAHETDDRNATDMNRVASRTDRVDTTALIQLGEACSAQPDFRGNPACEVPAGDDR